MVRQLITFLAALVFIVVTAVAVIAYGRGHTFNIREQTVTTSGILTVASFPEKASIWINDELSGVTNSSLSLEPGVYTLRVRKEGYQEWGKTIKVQGEVVTTIDALLIPTSPSLQTLTASGVRSPVLSPSGSQVAFISRDDDRTPASTLETKTGIWRVELRTSPLGWKSEPKKIFTPRDPATWEFPKLSWSPDETSIVTDATTAAMLLPIDGTSTPTELAPVFLASQKLQWEAERQEKTMLALAALPEPMGDFLASTAATIRFSPDDTKIFYEATASAALPPLQKLIVGSNSTPESRTIVAGTLYVYDQKEQKNFAIAQTNHVYSLDTTLWYNDSKHIVLVEKDTIYIVDYDGTNKRAIYAGPFDPSVLFPWPPGGKLVILTNFNKPQTPPNLYLLDLT